MPTYRCVLRAAMPTLALLMTLLAFLPSAHAVGLLVPTRSDITPLSIRYHRVSVSVRERIAETRVEQTFVNHTGETLEAYYVFPLPEGATVSGFAMWVNGTRQEGELLEAGRARTIYEGIVARMRDPGLVESLGGNLFRARVFPIAPYGEQRIEITFTQTLEYEGGLVHYRYPLRTPGSVSSTLADCTISLDIASRTPIRAIYSPTHTVAVARGGEHQATASFEANGVALDSDFDLYYGVADGDVGLSLLTHRPSGEDGYFLAMVAPRTEITDAEITGKDVLFVLDTSGSMAGDKIERARDALDYMLSRLSPSDSFQVVRFSTDVETVFDGGQSVPATPENIARARRFTRRLVAAGGTAIHPALTEALRQRRPSGSTGPRMVVFLTDGMPTVGVTEPARIVADVTASAGGARLFVFGLGDDVNTTFLDQLAQSNGGRGDYFRDGSELARRMASFFDRVAYPVFVDLHLSLPGVSAYDVYPRDLGHLYRGDQILVVGRYRGEGPGRVVLEGRLGHERTPREIDFAVNFPSTEQRNEFLPRVWAVRKVGTLLDEIRLNGERPELRDEVVSVARRFGIVTPYTSYLVVEDDARLAIPTERMPVPEVFLRIEASGGAVPMVEPAMPTAPSMDFEGYESTVAEAPSSVDSGSHGSAASTAASAAPSAAPDGGSGERGRRISGSIREMRDAEREETASESSMRYALGRAFSWRHGAWVDSNYRSGLREIEVRPMSAAFFALLSARPELREALAMGDRVVVTLDGARAVVVSPDAADTSAADLRRFIE